MIPDGVLSTQTAAAAYVDPVKQPGQRLVDYERGGIGLQDTSQGLQVKVWTLEVIGDDVILSAPATPRHTLFSASDISEVGLAFDQAMRPFVAYITNGVAKYWWYDTAAAAQVHTTLGSDCRCVCCTTDEKRTWHLQNSDIILCYLRGDQLCARYQRERYLSEHVLQTVGPQAQLISVGMSRSNRLQWRLRKTLPRFLEPDPEDALGSSTLVAHGVQQKPTVAETVSDLYRRSGIPEASIDASDLAASELEGFKVATESGADQLVQSLQAAFFFDPVESDRRLIAKARGSEPVRELSVDDLVAGDGSALRITRIQQAELLRKVTVTTLDSTINYTSNSQMAERTSTTIQAKAEASVEIPITATPDVAKHIAENRLRVAWGEVQSYKFSLSLAHSDLCPGDVIIVRDAQNTRHRMRIGMISEEQGRLEIEASDDAAWIYREARTSNGIQAKAPTSTSPGIAGDTVLTVMDLPVLRERDDETGYYLAVHGTGSAWTGGEVQLSLDAGATISQRMNVTTAAIIGKSLNPLLAEISSETSSWQGLAVAVEGDLASVSKDALQRYRNLAAVQSSDGRWEVIQFQTAVATQPGVYTLSGLVRGRYATTPSPAATGARFVLLDDAVSFVSLPLWMLQQQLHVRGISYGQEADAVPWTALAKTNSASQTEWPVHGVYARRDANNSVTVGWIGRARLGIETQPRHSQYFAGYRVIYSDGVTAETTDTLHIRTAAPQGLTVQVAPLNRLTGQGPLSKEINV